MTNHDKIQKALIRQCERYKSQTAYAEAVGVSPQYISQLLKGQNSVDALSLAKLEQLFPEMLEIQILWTPQAEWKERRLSNFLSALSPEEQQKAITILKAVFQK